MEQVCLLIKKTLFLNSQSTDKTNRDTLITNRKIMTSITNKAIGITNTWSLRIYLMKSSTLNQNRKKVRTISIVGYGMESLQILISILLSSSPTLLTLYLWKIRNSKQKHKLKLSLWITISRRRWMLRNQVIWARKNWKMMLS